MFLNVFIMRAKSIEHLRLLGIVIDLLNYYVVKKNYI